MPLSWWILLSRTAGEYIWRASLGCPPFPLSLPSPSSTVSVSVSVVPSERASPLSLSSARVRPDSSPVTSSAEGALSWK